MRLSTVALTIIAAAWPTVAAHAATCGPPERATLVIGIREAPITIRSDFSLVDLQRMSTQLALRPMHPVLGFYSATVGYTLHNVADPSAGGDPQCPQTVIHAEFVAIDRSIQIAKDLSNLPCLHRAAIEHYRQHAEAASRALHNFAVEHTSELEQGINDHLRGRREWPQSDASDLGRYVGKRLTQAVGAFSKSLGEVQTAVDSPAQIHTLTTVCGEI